jgi:hypothetical protein
VSSTIIPKSAPCSGATCILAPRNALVSSLNALNTPHSRVFRSKYAYKSSVIANGAVFQGPVASVDELPSLDDATRVVDLTSGCVTTGGGGSLARVQNAFRVAADVTADARGITVVIARMSVRRVVVHASRNARLETTAKTTYFCTRR